MKFKKTNSMNLYLVLVLVSLFLLVVLLFDQCIGLVNRKLESRVQVEGFESPSSSHKTSKNKVDYSQNISPVSSPESSDMSPTSKFEYDEDIELDIDEKDKAKNEVEDISFMHEVENKDLYISDFYPSEKVRKMRSREDMWKYTQELDLFAQIIPKLKKGYLGIVNFDKRVAGIYHTDDLEKKKWTKLERDIPSKMVHPLFINYDKDRMLLGIFEDKHKHRHMYKKDCTSLDSEWVYLGVSPVVSFIYDEDGILLGLDTRGNIHKKTNSMLESEWEELVVNFDVVPMRQLLFDYQSGIMMGVGKDFRIYQKRYDDWIDSDWGEGTPKTLAGAVRHIFYDHDGLLVGLSRVGLVKKKDSFYLSDFKIYKTPKENTVSVYKITYAISGVKNMAQYAEKNNSNNVYVDGKKISEYKFKDKRLNDFLDYRMKLKSQCRRLKAMKIINDNKKQKEETQVRNQKFNRILNEQKNTIDTLMDTIQQLKDSNF